MNKTPQDSTHEAVKQLRKSINMLEDRFIAKGIPPRDPVVTEAIKGMKIYFANQCLSSLAQEES